MVTKKFSIIYRKRCKLWKYYHKHDMFVYIFICFGKTKNKCTKKNYQRCFKFITQNQLQGTSDNTKTSKSENKNSVIRVAEDVLLVYVNLLESGLILYGQIRPCLKLAWKWKKMTPACRFDFVTKIKNTTFVNYLYVKK